MLPSAQYNSPNSKRIINIAKKRQRFQEQVRKQYLKLFFSEQRKKISQHIKNQQIEQQFNQLVIQMFAQISEDKAMYYCTQIIDFLKNESVDIGQILNKFGNKLIQIFIKYPNRVASLKMLSMIIKEAYPSVFKENAEVNRQNSQQYSYISRNQMTMQQLSIDILLEVFDSDIDLLNDRKSLRNNVNNTQLQNHNKNIEDKIGTYCRCFKWLSIFGYQFSLRQIYASKYINRWIRLIFLKYQYFNPDLLFYFHAYSTQHIVFESFNSQIKKVSKYIEEQESIIINRMFEACLPTDKQNIRSDKKAYLCVDLLMNLWTNNRTKIIKINMYLNKIFGFIKVVLNNQSFYQVKGILKQYQVLRAILERYTTEILRQNLTQQQRGMLKSVCLLKQMKKFQFIQNLQMMLKCVRNHQITMEIYKLIKMLIKYCISLNLELKKLFQSNELLVYLVQGINVQNKSAILQNLDSINMICIYSQQYNQRQYFIQFIRQQIDVSLDRLCYCKNPEVATFADQVLVTFFNQQVLEAYDDYQHQMDEDDHEYADRMNLYY